MDKHRRRIPPIATFTAITYLYGAADTRRPPPVIPVLTTIPARPPPGTHGAPKPVGSFPGNALDARTSAWLPPDAPPSAAGGRLNLVGGRLWVPCCGSAMGWWPGSRGPRACTWPPGRVSGGSCGMAVDGREIVVSILRTLPQPSTAIPQVPPVVPHYIILENNLRDGLELIDRTCYARQTGCTSSSKRTSSSSRYMPNGRERARPNQRKHAGILSCTLALPRYPIHCGV